MRVQQSASAMEQNQIPSASPRGQEDLLDNHFSRFSDLAINDLVDMGDMAEFNAIFGNGLTFDSDFELDDHAHHHQQHPIKPRMSDLARAQLHQAAAAAAAAGGGNSSPRFSMAYSPPSSVFSNSMVPTPPTSAMFVLQPQSHLNLNNPIIPTPPTMLFAAAQHLQQQHHHHNVPSIAQLTVIPPPYAHNEDNGEEDDDEEDDHMHPTNNNVSADDEKQRRRENNKNSARNSRKKKKDYVLVLQENIQVLTREIAMLRYEVKRRQRAHHQSVGSTLVPMQVTVRYTFENLMRVVSPPHLRFLLWNVHKRALASTSEPQQQQAVETSAWYKTWQEVSNLMQLTGEQNERISVLFKAKKSTDNHAAEEREKVALVFQALTKLRQQYELLADQFAVQRQLFQRYLLVQQQQPPVQQNAWSVCADFVLSNPHESPALRSLLTPPIPNPNRDVSNPGEEMRRILELLSV